MGSGRGHIAQLFFFTAELGFLTWNLSILLEGHDADSVSAASWKMGTQIVLDLSVRVPSPWHVLAFLVSLMETASRSLLIGSIPVVTYFNV